MNTKAFLAFSTILTFYLFQNKVFGKDLPLGTKRLYEQLEITREDGSSVLSHPPPAEMTRDNVCELTHANQTDGNCAQASPYVAIVSRHGARFPTKKKKQLLVSFAERVCIASENQPALKPAQEWCQRVLEEVGPARAGSLTEVGKGEMHDMGVWFTNTYLKPYGIQGQDISKLNLSSTRSTSFRTLQSCRQFFAGTSNASVYDFEVEELCRTAANDLLKPYKKCGHLQDLRTSFKESLHITPSVRSRSVRRLTERTGLQQKEILNSDDLLAAYFACQTDVATHPDTPFEERFACNLLGPFLGEFSLLEHLENYELRGFGEPVAKELMVDLLRQLTDNIEASVARLGSAENECVEYPAFDLYFSHDSAVLPLAALLGIFDFGVNPYSAHAAMYCPFSSRLVIEVASCGAILVSYNEKLVRMYEDFDVWKNQYNDILSKNIDDICGFMPKFDPLIDTSAIL